MVFAFKTGDFWGVKVPNSPGGESVTATEPPEWIALAGPSTGAAPAAVSPARVLTRIVFGALGVLIVFIVTGSMTASRLSEKEAVRDAANRARVVTGTVVQPALSDALVSGDPE